MSEKVSVTKSKLDYLADMVAARTGELAPLTIDEMAAAMRYSLADGDYLGYGDDSQAMLGTMVIGVARV